MYSILIADDEKYVRQDIIRSVNWTDHGYFIVGKHLMALRHWKDKKSCSLMFSLQISACL